MKNKDLLLSLILVLIVILCGIGLGYLIFRSTDKEINVEILKIDDYTEDIYINGKLIFDNFVSANGVNYKIIDDKVFFSDFGTGGGGNSLYVYNRNGEQLLKVNNDDAFLPNNLLYEYMVYDELNNKIFLFSSIQAEDAQSENISGKGSGIYSGHSDCGYQRGIERSKMDRRV